MSLREASKNYGIPLTTLHRYATESAAQSESIQKLKRRGPPPKLSAETEESMSNFLTCLAEIGLPFSRGRFLTLVEGFLEHTKQDHLFDNKRPTKNWYYSFLGM
jgi:hypothetical protein